MFLANQMYQNEAWKLWNTGVSRRRRRIWGTFLCANINFGSQKCHLSESFIKGNSSVCMCVCVAVKAFFSFLCKCMYWEYLFYIVVRCNTNSNLTMQMLSWFKTMLLLLWNVLTWSWIDHQTLDDSKRRKILIWDRSFDKIAAFSFAAEIVNMKNQYCENDSGWMYQPQCTLYICEGGPLFHYTSQRNNMITCKV